MTKTITHIRGLGKFTTSVGNLVTNVNELKGRLASLRNDALLRLKTSGNQNIGKTEGTRVALEFDYIKGANPVVIKYDKLSLSLAEKVVRANRVNKYHCTDSTKRYDTNAKKAEKEEQSGVPYEKRSAILLPRENFKMSLDENSNHFAFFLEDLAGKEGENSYFALNEKNPIEVYLIDKKIVDGERDLQLLQSQGGTIVVPYGWFRSLDSRSELDGNGRNANYYDDRARGVLEGSGEATSPKILSLPYTQRQIITELNRFSKLEKEIQKSRQFLESLKQ